VTQAFPGMDKQSSVFYSRIFAEVMLNFHAVRMGLYPIYLSEMDSPAQSFHWRSSIPTVMDAFRRRRMRDM